MAHVAMQCQSLNSVRMVSSGLQACPPQRIAPPAVPSLTLDRASLQPAKLSAGRKCSVKQRVQAAPQRSDISTRQAAHKPTSAETAKTIVDIVAHGTLCTVGEDGVPLGTYTSYILDGRGMPVLRLRADAVHTANLRRSPKCSLFVQPGTQTRLCLQSSFALAALSRFLFISAC